MTRQEITENTRVALNAAQIIIAVSAIFLGGFAANKWVSSVERNAANGSTALVKVEALEVASAKLGEQMAGLARAMDALTQRIDRLP